MKRSEIQEYFKNGRAVVAKETYAIAKTRRAIAGAFAIVRDRNEISCVVEESKLRPRQCLGIEGDWRLLTFDMILPFSLVGFFALISSALAEAGISIFTISAYSTDHIFVKNKDLERAVKSLETLGMTIRRL